MLATISAIASIPLEARRELATEGAVTRWLACNVAELCDQCAIFHGEISPADEAITPKERVARVAEAVNLVSCTEQRRVKRVQAQAETTE